MGDYQILNKSELKEELGGKKGRYTHKQIDSIIQEDGLLFKTERPNLARGRISRPTQLYLLKHVKLALDKQYPKLNISNNFFYKTNSTKTENTILSDSKQQNTDNVSQGGNGDEKQVQMENSKKIPNNMGNKSKIYLALKDYTIEQARIKKQPIYCVLCNEVLKSIASECPSNIADLLKIKGIGPKKIEQYGKDILKIIDRFYWQEIYKTWDISMTTNAEDR